MWKEGNLHAMEKARRMDPGDAPPPQVGAGRSPKSGSPAILWTSTQETEGTHSSDSSAEEEVQFFGPFDDLLPSSGGARNVDAYDPYDEEEQPERVGVVDDRERPSSHTSSSARQIFHSLPTIDEVRSYAGRTAPRTPDRAASGRNFGALQQPNASMQEQPRSAKDKNIHLVRKQLLKVTAKLCVGILCIMLGLLAVAWIVHRREDRISDAEQAGSNLAGQLEAAMNFLTENNISARQALVTTGSPQQKAVQWMVAEDALSLTIPATAFTSEATAFVQRYAFVVFYYATGGDTTWESDLSFLSSEHECGWFQEQAMAGFIGEEYAVGLSCGTDMVAVNLFIPSNGLTGSLPPELTQLRELTLLGLPHNQLDQELDDGIFQSLSQLEYLDLKYNLLRGRLPENVGDLTELRVLGLSNNQFTGSLPASMSQLVRLQTLALDDNGFDGSLDVVTDYLTNLEFFYADRNEFLHFVDEKFAVKLQRLRELDLSQNLLYSSASMELPAHLFAHASLQVLDLAANNLRGSLPSEMAPNLVLQFLSLRHNGLFGPVTAFSLPRMERLTHLDLQDNLLQGELPALMAGLTDLTYLALGDNQWDSHDLPEWLWQISSLRELSLPSAGLRGAIPTGLEALTDLELLDLSQNGLTGELPPEVWNLPQLAYLLMHDTTLNGNILTTTQLLGADTLQLVTLFQNSGLEGSVQALCDQAPNLDLLAADCNIDCPCCATCCDTPDCFVDEIDDLYRYKEGSWEFDYTRTAFAFDPALLDVSSFFSTMDVEDEP
jgi:Leucine-rich repeat (LRR) protein